MGFRILFSAGVLFAALGAVFLYFGISERSPDNAAALPRARPNEVRKFSAGSELLVEGFVVPSEPLGREDYVVFTEEEFMGYESGGPSEGKPRWKKKTFERRKFLVEKDAANVAVCARYYHLAGALHSEGPNASLTRGDLVRSATTRRSGVRARDPATLHGRFVSNENCFEAETVFVGSAAAYVESLRTGAFVQRLVGGIFLFAGLVLSLIGFRIRRG